MRTVPALLAICLLIPHSGALGAPPVPGEPAPEAVRIIRNLDLQAAPTTLSARESWQPRRVLVMLLPGQGLDSQEYEAALRAAAGDLELVLDRSGAPVPTAQSLEGVDAVIGLCSPATLSNAGKELRWLHSYFVGMDRCMQAPAAVRERVVFTNGQRLSAPAIAEHTIAMLLALSRNLPAYQGAQAQGRWQRGLAQGATFGELADKTLLVAGLGGIGTEVARRAHGLGMRVVATRNSSREGPDFVEYVGLADELHALAAKADVIVNALPLTAATAGLFDKQFFAAAKPGAIFLSVGRGGSTVTGDLLAALESGSLYGAGLDVTDPEPLPADHPLWRLPNVIITPHVAASGGDSMHRAMVIAAENLRRYAAGEPMLSVVDMTRGY